MLIVTGTIELPAAGVEQMKEAARVMARATRQEDGCHTYAFWQDIENECVFRVYEEWESRAHLKAHGETAHMATFRAAIGKVGVVSRNIVSFDAGEMSPLG
ncbi:MAG: putative quinol monooxygenase [Sedimentitalea sp.]